MLDVKELCERLAKFHWSPRLPTTYVTGMGTGLGVAAPTCYGTFNLVWASHELDTVADHWAALQTFGFQVPYSTQVVAGAQLSDWLTLLNPQEFSFWYEDNKRKVSSHSRKNIEKALDGLHNIQRI